MNLYVTFSGLLTIAAILAAYQLGRMVERPEKAWPKGGMLKFGWAAWKIPLIVIIGVTVLFNVLWPIVKVSGLTRGLGGQHYGGGGMYGGGNMYGGGMY